MQPRARVEVTRRLAVLAGVILLWGAFILLKLVYLQVFRHKEYARLARAQQEIRVELPAPRGAILERSGELLAISTPVDSVSINPRKVPDLLLAAKLLSPILSLDQAALYGRMQWATARNLGFLWVKRKISPQESERLRSLKLDWIQFHRETQRHYPNGALAAHVIGSVDHQEKGNSGLERRLDAVLRGEAGAVRMLTDVKRRPIAERADTTAHPGLSVTLTIDERIQYITEVALAQAVQASRGETGSATVMNPYTGDILALASYPVFDPSQPLAKSEDGRIRHNHAVSVPFEPGSVFKIFTLSAALETTRLGPDSPINCGNGVIRIGGRTIHEAKRGFGTIPMKTVLAKSSNIGAIKIGDEVGRENLYRYVRLFGFGQRTAIPLPAESPGMLWPLNQWRKTSLSSVAMGHEVSATTLQLVRACAAIANGGLLVKPRLILRKGGTQVAVEPPQRILRPETAIMMRRMMEGVVLPGGTGTAARLKGYSSGGKTGSAQIYDPATRHYMHKYNASFVGFAPLPNPAIVVVVTVNKTHLFGGAASAPAFRMIAEEALRVLGVPKDLPDIPPAAGKHDPDQENDLAIAELGEPGPGLLEPATAIPDEAAAAVDADPDGPRAPDFRGMTKRAVVQTAQEQGLLLLTYGEGIARRQDPPAGAALQEGERIRVQFAK